MDNRKNLKKLIVILLELGLILIVLIIIGYFSFNWALSSLVHTRKEVSVPDLMEKDTKTALDILAANNLAIKKAGEEYDPNTPEGYIVRQLPPAGTKVREGKNIRVWFSQGSEEVYTPNIMGMNLRDAKFTIRKNYLSLGEITNAYSLNYEKGTVISQDPYPDTILAKNTQINLIVSDGIPPDTIIMMPELRQKNLSEATVWASEKNINLTIKEDKRSLFPNGIIVDQNPSPDTAIKQNYQVEVTVSRRKIDEDEKFYRVHYELSQGRKESQVRVVIIDESGERELLNDVKQPGSKVDLSIPYDGEATVRIFVNGILARESEIK